MKNKILSLALLILSLLFPLHSQTGWSDPVRVSGIGRYAESAVTTDNNGVLSAFWFKDIKLDVGYYSIIEFSQSINEGLNWTAPVNITPEYDIDPNYQWGPLWEIRAVTDSKNNIHLIYAKGLENKVLVYKKYDGISWTVDYVINCSLANNMRFGIDATDMLFATWTLGSTTYYMYCDTQADSIAWSTPKKIHPDIDYQTFGFTFDKNNDIYAIGKNDTDTSIGSCVFKYNKIDDNWHNFEQVYNFGETNLGCAIVLSKNDSLYSNIFVGSSMLYNNDYQNQKYIQDSTWSIPVNINSKNNDWNRKLFVDSKNIIHLFERHRSAEGIHSLNHTYGKGTSWQTETIHSDPNFFIFWFDVKRKVFEEYDEYYVLYCKSRVVDGIYYNRINYQTKRISTGIEDYSENIPESAILYQNYPNPFNNSTEISYSINNSANVKISIFNTMGEFVQSLVNKKQNIGKHSVTFNADNYNSGIYYYQLEVDGIVKDTKKMLYLK